MGVLHIDLFTTLDLVAQAPGGPDEDPSGGFPFGGWQAPFPDEVVGEQVGAGIAAMDALLLGRRTYDIFAAYWPQHESGLDGEIGATFAAIPKYVASRGTPELTWRGSTLLGPDGATPSVLRLLESPVTGSTGVVQLRYGPTGSAPSTGDMSEPDRGTGSHR